MVKNFIMQENAVKKLMVEKICLPLRHEKHAVVAQLVEHWLPKPRVAGSSPVYRSIINNYRKIMNRMVDFIHN